ncbi:MFS transporter [Streptomyces sp. NPDC019531]|uniref:MFS transporter n=1 Tax=Streptomyces sp. NPDC019531 TaxID=3365062 RepID=UPI00384CC5B6
MNTPGASTGRGLRGHPWLTLTTLTLGAMMVSLDTTVVAVAQPVMRNRLDATIGDIQWVTAGYLLALAALLVIAGRAGDRFGHRRTFLVGTAGFVCSSALIGLSPHISWVIAFRVLQGVFGAFMQPPTLALLRTTFPADRLNVPIALRSGALGTATAAGPVVGGLLVAHGDWRPVFFVNLPLGALTFGLGLLVLRETRPDPAARAGDTVAVLLLAGTLLALVWGAVRAPDHGWSDARTWSALTGAAMLGAGFCRWESRARAPLVPLSLFRSPRFTAGVLLMTLVSFVLFGVPFVLAFQLQNVLGMSPVNCGLLVLWLTLAMVLSGIATGLLMHRTGAPLPAVVGMGVTAVAVLGVAHAVTAGPADAGLRCWLVLLGLGFSAVIVAATHLIVREAPVRNSGVASGIQQTAMQIGGSLGTAVLGGVLAARVGTLLPERLTDAGVHLTGGALDKAVRSAATGVTSDALTGAADHAVRDSFSSGLHTALLLSATLAVLAAGTGTALLRRRGGTAEKEGHGGAEPREPVTEPAA